MIHLFDKYFLVLVLISGFVVRIIDCNKYKRENQGVLFKKAKFISNAVIILVIGLFIAGKVID